MATRMSVFSVIRSPSPPRCWFSARELCQRVELVSPDPELLALKALPASRLGLGFHLGPIPVGHLDERAHDQVLRQPRRKVDVIDQGGQPVGRGLRHVPAAHGHVTGCRGLAGHLEERYSWGGHFVCHAGTIAPPTPTDRPTAQVSRLGPRMSPMGDKQRATSPWGCSLGDKPAGGCSDGDKGGHVQMEDKPSGAKRPPGTPGSTGGIWLAVGDRPGLVGVPGHRCVPPWRHGHQCHRFERVLPGNARQTDSHVIAVTNSEAAWPRRWSRSAGRPHRRRIRPRLGGRRDPQANAYDLTQAMEDPAMRSSISRILPSALRSASCATSTPSVDCPGSLEGRDVPPRCSPQHLRHHPLRSPARVGPADHPHAGAPEIRRPPRGRRHQGGPRPARSSSSTLEHPEREGIRYFRTVIRREPCMANSLKMVS